MLRTPSSIKAHVEMEMAVRKSRQDALVADLQGQMAQIAAEREAILVANDYPEALANRASIKAHHDAIKAAIMGGYADEYDLDF